MPSSASAPKITIGISRIFQIFGLWSKIPIPISNAVTTAQIVSTMKRGENGSSSVSIEPSPKLFLPAHSLVQPMRQAHTIYGPALADVTTGAKNIRGFGSALFAVQRDGPV